MGNKVSFRVFKRKNALDDEIYDVTYEEEWYIDPDGKLMFITDDIDDPLKEAGDEYFYTVEVL